MKKDEQLEIIIESAISFIYTAGKNYTTQGGYTTLRAEIQKIIDYLEKPAIGETKVEKQLDPYLKNLWDDFLLWDTGKHNGKHDDKAESFIKEIGAIDHEPIAFMAYVAGREWK
ncbi:hypothetical protein FACS189447_07630 [Spirochaetia bacterium]|nr:hypothetical protein FACS189447_07630 [Spirochaetia bacterium]